MANAVLALAVYMDTTKYNTLKNVVPMSLIVL